MPEPVIVPRKQRGKRGHGHQEVPTGTKMLGDNGMEKLAVVGNMFKDVEHEHDGMRRRRARRCHPDGVRERSPDSPEVFRPVGRIKADDRRPRESFRNP
jgi:hypothetical protein